MATELVVESMPVRLLVSYERDLLDPFVPVAPTGLPLTSEEVGALKPAAGETPLSLPDAAEAHIVENVPLFAVPPRATAIGLSCANWDPVLSTAKGIIHQPTRTSACQTPKERHGPRAPDDRKTAWNQGNSISADDYAEDWKCVHWASGA